MPVFRLFLIIFVALIVSGCDFFKRSITGPSIIFDNSSQTNIKYYGYYFVEDPAKGLNHIDEIRDYTNIINVRYDNGMNNSWDPSSASRILASDSRIMLQIPFGTDTDQTLFVNSYARKKYLNKIRQDMTDTGVTHIIAYIAIYEEWYVLINHGHYDWPIFKGLPIYEKFAVAKQYLEEIISDVNQTFPGIPTVIVENILPLPDPPSNLDIIGVDAYYIPTSPDCSPEEKLMFDNQVIPHYDAARIYGKPIMVVAPSFIHGPWRMLSECQMQWYVDLALDPTYNIQSFLWFLYNYDNQTIVGVRNFPDLVNYQRGVSCQFFGNQYCP